MVQRKIIHCDLALIISCVYNLAERGNFYGVLSKAAPQ